MEEGESEKESRSQEAGVRSHEGGKYLAGQKKEY